MFSKSLEATLVLSLSSTKEVIPPCYCEIQLPAKTLPQRFLREPRCSSDATAVVSALPIILLFLDEVVEFYDIRVLSEIEHKRGQSSIYITSVSALCVQIHSTCHQWTQPSFFQSRGTCNLAKGREASGHHACVEQRLEWGIFGVS